MDAPETLLRISLPARAEFVGIVRGVLMTAAGRSGLTIDAGDDLALAVDEMSAALLHSGGTGRLVIVVVESPAGIQVEATAEGVAGPWPPADWASSTAAMILEALVDDVVFARSNGTASITVAKTAVTLT